MEIEDRVLAKVILNDSPIPQVCWVLNDRIVMELIESVVKHYVLDGVPEIGLRMWRLYRDLTMSEAWVFVHDLYERIRDNFDAQYYGSIPREPGTRRWLSAKVVKEAFYILMADSASWPGE